MKLKFVSAIALCAMAIFSCDEDTGTLGDSLTSEGNRLVITTQDFSVLSRYDESVSLAGKRGKQTRHNDSGL